MLMKNLIVYYSFTRNNEKLAEHLQKLLNCDIAKIETIKKRNAFSILLDLVFKRKSELKAIEFHLADYDHIIFIAPIWAGKIAMPLKSFLIDEKTSIKNYSFITICGGGNPEQKTKIEQELALTVQMRPLNVVELWVSDLLSAEKKDTIKYTSGSRIEAGDLAKFETKLREFIKGENLVPAV
jgi:flavodoxin